MLEDVDEILETMGIEEAPHVDDEIQPTEKFGESQSVTDFKGFEALRNIVLDIGDQLLCSDVQTQARQVYDELRQSFETFIGTLTIWHWMSNVQNSRIRNKWFYMIC